MFGFKHKKSVPEVEVTVSNQTIVRVLAMVLLFIIALAALKQMAHALLLLFIAFFLSLALNAPVHWIDKHLPGKKHKTRSLATVASVLVVLVVLVGFLAAIVPPLQRQVGSLVDAVPGLVQQLHNHNSEINHLISRYHLQSQVDNFSSEVAGRLKGLSGEAVSVITHAGSSAISVLIILVLTFMMLVEGPRWVSVAERLVPAARRDHARELSTGMYNVIRGYVNGQVILAAIASVLIVPMLFILHISYPLALMFVIFVCGLIPMIGHTIGAVIVTAVALFHSATAAAIILVYYLLYQQIENYLIQPRIQANTTNLSPLLVFIAVVLGVSFGGLIGGLVAIPVMGCLRILTLDILTRRNLLESEKAEAIVAKAETE